MTHTARRRWTRELSSEVDGIAVGDSGPILLHGYDPPAGGRWIDSAIPGKLASLDRSTGEVLWVSPCEVGYGRGFGAGFGEGDEVKAGQLLLRLEDDQARWRVKQAEANLEAARADHDRGASMREGGLLSAEEFEMEVRRN